MDQPKPLAAMMMLVSQEIAKLPPNQQQVANLLLGYGRDYLTSTKKEADENNILMALCPNCGTVHLLKDGKKKSRT